MFPNKKETIYGENKSVRLKNFKEKDMVDDIETDLFQEKLPGLNLAGMRAEYKKALADPEMGEGSVKAGVVGSDLVWKAKSSITNKVYSVILYKNYTKKYQEALERAEEAATLNSLVQTTGSMAYAQAKATEEWEKYHFRITKETAEKVLAVGVSPDGAWLARDEGKQLTVSQRKGSRIRHVNADRQLLEGKGPAEAGLGLDLSKGIETVDDFKQRRAFADAIAEVRKSPGYIDELSFAEAAAKLADSPDESWIVHGSAREEGLVEYSWKRGGKVSHTRIDSVKDIQGFKRYSASRAEGQVKS